MQTILAYARSPEKEQSIEDAQIGWLGAIIIGGIAGWLAEVVTRSKTLPELLVPGIRKALFALSMFETVSRACALATATSDRRTSGLYRSPENDYPILAA